MKKVYLGLLMTTIGAGVFAQVNTSGPAKMTKHSGFKQTQKAQSMNEKAGGDVIWNNGFTTTSDWTTSNDPAGTPPHTQGDWSITSTMPANLTSQQATYGYPATLNSTSGGNFAIINSDLAGQGQSQNAFITTTNGIDVASLLTTNGSAANAALYLEFTEIYRHYYDENFVEISNDNGVTWTTFQVNPVTQVPVNTNSGNPEVEIVNITSAIGAGNWGSQVKIRFKYLGEWDWFWAIDDVKLVVAYDNDAKLNILHQATPLATSLGLDYYRVPVSQTSFPGITFGSKIQNNGGATQNNVSLKVVGPSYNQSSTTKALVSGQVDTFDISTPYMLPGTAGSYTLHATSDLGITDEFMDNDSASITVVRDPYLFGRDDNKIMGGISQVTNNDAQELMIGNVMEIFDNMTVTGIQVRLLNQATAVGQEFNCVIYKLNTTTSEYEFYAETEYHLIANGNLSQFVTIPMDGGDVQLNAGDDVLVMAHNLGGANEVGFGYAQTTEEQTVLGYTQGATTPFYLSSPGAIMIRLTSDPSLSVSENELNASVNVFPNPAVEEFTVTVDGNEATGITVVDLTGKVVYSSSVNGTITVNTSNFAAGMYTVNVETTAGIASKKLIVRK